MQDKATDDESHPVSRQDAAKDDAAAARKGRGPRVSRRPRNAARDAERPTGVKAFTYRFLGRAGWFMTKLVAALAIGFAVTIVVALLMPSVNASIYSQIVNDGFAMGSSTGLLLVIWGLPCLMADGAIMAVVALAARWVWRWLDAAAVKCLDWSRTELGDVPAAHDNGADRDARAARRGGRRTNGKG